MISVIVPFYKPPKLRFRKCLESIINQTYKNFEVLLVDDGNDEEYLLTIKDYLTEFDNIKLISKKNGGVSSARNLGIEKSKGRYIVFIDSDDYIEMTFLEELRNGISDSDLAICGIREQFFPVVNGWFDRKVFFSLPEIFCKLQYTNFSVNKIYKKEIIELYNIRFDENIKLGEDAVFLSKYFLYCKSIRCIENELYHYIPNKASAVNTFYNEYWNWEKSVIDNQYSDFNQYPLYKIQNQYLEYWLYIKFKGSFYYYLYNNEGKYINNIAKHDLFNKLMISQYKKNQFYNKKDKCIIFLWKYFSISGIKSSFLIKNLINKFK